MFSSLRFRLWLTYVLVVGMVLGIATLTVGLYLVRNPTIDRLELQRLRLLSSLLIQRSPIFSRIRDELPASRLQELAERIDETSNVRVVVFDANGEMLADSRAEAAPAIPPYSFFVNQEQGVRRSFRDAAIRQWLYHMTSLESGNSLLLAIPRPRIRVINILRDEFIAPFLRGAALAMSLSLLLAIWIAGWITAPLQRMAQAARSFSTGKFRNIPLEGPGEVKDLANSFNEMGERVQASQRSQRDFIANVSHDLKTPLTSIQGFAQAILDGTARDPVELHQAAEVIHNEADRMYHMIQDLLELARLDSGVVEFERASINLDILLRGVVQEFAPLAKKRQIELDLLSEAAAGNFNTSVVGDSERLSQVFSNLVENALKFTPSGGRVEVSIRSGIDWIEVRVSDTGAGIPGDELERIFERFYQTDKSRRGGSDRGVGLGLAIAREIVQAHGGTISAFNRDQIIGTGVKVEETPAPHGSAFVVRLPTAQLDASTVLQQRKGDAVRSNRNP